MKVVAGLSWVSEKKIRELNRKYRKLDKPTDVLSFPLEDMNVGPDGVIRLGDIVICKVQAEKKGHTIPFLIKHAMLHLLGIHHH